MLGLADQEVRQIQTLDDNGLDEAANIIMDRYRVLADSSDLPGTSNITPFGAIDDEMHGGIRDILVEVAELGRLCGNILCGWYCHTRRCISHDANGC